MELGCLSSPAGSIESVALISGLILWVKAIVLDDATAALEAGRVVGRNRPTALVINDCQLQQHGPQWVVERTLEGTTGGPCSSADRAAASSESSGKRRGRIRSSRAGGGICRSG